MTAIIEKERARRVIEPQHAEQQAEVANAGREKGLLGGGSGGRFVKPEADEQVRGETYEFPADEEQQEAVGDEQPEHRGGEEAQETEELFEVRVVLHVAEAEDEGRRELQTVLLFP